MKTIHYISPSIFPSKSANSVHVIHQCSALSNQNIILYLYGAGNFKRRSYKKKLETSYGVNLRKVNLILIKPIFKKAINMQIAIYAFFRIFFDSFNKDHIIFTRNLYGALIFNFLLKKEILFETHQIENGFNGYLQKKLLISKKTTTILITKQLKNILEEHFSIRINKYNIFSDAAPSNIDPIKSKSQKISTIKEYINYDSKFKYICGYFGHLYEGRGIEIIIELSRKIDDVLFLVYGGNEVDVERLKQKHSNKNLMFMGYVENSMARKMMLSVDILLMPYQKEVSIGLKGHDTARWMSPMKMFEYMATKNPIISSNLPALREVLINGENAILVQCDNVLDWENAIKNIILDKELSDKISNNAYFDYKEKYNWDIRAKKIIDIINHR